MANEFHSSAGGLIKGPPEEENKDASPGTVDEGGEEAESKSEQIEPTETKADSSPEKKSKKKKKKTPVGRLIEDFVYLMLKIVVIATGIMVVMTYIFGVTVVSDKSMDPAVKDGDVVLYYRLDKAYTAQDTLVLRFDGELQVRRVIATEGSVIDITDRGLTINGYLQQEANIYVDTLQYTMGVDFPLTVGPGQVFVLGDARTEAIDSRIYGCVDVSDTLGKTFAVIRKRGI